MLALKIVLYVLTLAAAFFFSFRECRDRGVCGMGTEDRVLRGA